MKRLKICTISLIIMLLMVNILMVNTVGAANSFVLATYNDITTLQFNGTKNSKWINASGVPEGIAWGNLTNTGTAPATFKISIDNSIVGIVLYVNNVDSVTGKKTITSYPGAWPGSSNLPAGSSVKLHMRANFTNMVDNTYTNNLIVQ